MMITKTLILVFAQAAFASFPSLGDVSGTLHNLGTAVEGTLKTIPETAVDVAKNIIDINGIPKIPRVPVPELIKAEGYPSESHYVTTDDDYILNIHRIPHGKSGRNNGKVVYLQHGFLAASSDWVLLGPERSLGYILADEGYDVWMGNARGNLYSRNHTFLSTESEKFWDFSWHEIGIYDIPAIIDYILDVTDKESLFHIGHSQGTTTFYVMASERPHYNSKIEAHISLAPIGFMDHVFSPLVRMMALGTTPLDAFMKLVGEYEFMPKAGFLNLLTHTTCSVGAGKVLCKNALFAIAGFSPDEMDASDLPLISAHYPAGAATKQIVHYGQEVQSKRFRQYDYGPMNSFKYGLLTPPDYQLGLISAPVHLIYGSNDWLAATTDVERLFHHLRNGKEMHNVPRQTWNHMDFLFAKSAPDYVYGKVLNILSRY